MPTFRVYFLDRGAHISRPPEIIECANDQEATEKARQFIDGLDIELWHQDRMVANFPKNRPVE